MVVSHYRYSQFFRLIRMFLSNLFDLQCGRTQSSAQLEKYRTGTWEKGFIQGGSDELKPVWVLKQDPLYYCLAMQSQMSCFH